MRFTGEAGKLPEHEQAVILATAAEIGVPATFLAAIRIAENGSRGSIWLDNVISRDILSLCVSSAGQILDLKNVPSAGVVYVLSDEDSITQIRKSIERGNAPSIRTTEQSTLSVRSNGERNMVLTLPSEKKNDIDDAFSYSLSGLNVVPVERAHAAATIKISQPSIFTTWTEQAKYSTFLGAESVLQTLKPLSLKQISASCCVLIATRKSTNPNLLQRNWLNSPLIIQRTLGGEILIGECMYRGGREFGVLSEDADTYDAQCRIAALSIRNNAYRYVARFKEWPVDPQGRLSEAFTKFMAARWAPSGVENDPTNLNAHWPGNVWRVHSGSGVSA